MDDKTIAERNSCCLTSAQPHMNSLKRNPIGAHIRLLVGRSMRRRFHLLLFFLVAAYWHVDCCLLLS